MSDAPPATVRADRLPRTVVALGWVSLCTDLASELIVPLLPVLLASVGGGTAALGLLQGVSDGAVSLLKALSGWLSDRQRRRKPWIVAGYTLSAVLRPLFALVASPLAAVLVRTGDRVGKGLRSAPRDALCADAVGPAQRGRAFGLLRAMDHAGALLGALCAALLLWLGVELRVVFALALLPGLLGVFVLWRFVPDAPRAVEAPPAADPPGAVRRLVPFLGVVVPSAVAGSVDLFALLRARELGVPDSALPLCWAVLHVARAGLAAPAGRWSDRIGRRPLLAIGLAAHALVLAGFAAATTPALLWPLFLGLGLHAGATEGAERGCVADLTGAAKRGTSFGVYHAVHGVAAFAGPIVLGFVWQQHGAGAAFLLASASAVVAVLWLLLGVRLPPSHGAVRHAAARAS